MTEAEKLAFPRPSLKREIMSVGASSCWRASTPQSRGKVAVDRRTPEISS